MATSRPPPPRLFQVLVAPLQAFLRTEAKGGILLLLAALAAFGLANSPWRAEWQALWELPLGVSLGGVALEGSLHFVVDDVLMAVFFFVVGMEIKRELVRGELRTPAQALLPAIAAVGGMVVPALLFVAFQKGGEGVRGWAIPMATDIAFSIGCLALLGNRVPHSLKVFLTALAIFDDIGGILVIALFYGTGIQPTGLLWTVVATGAAFGLNRLRVQGLFPYLLVGGVLWWAFHEAGLHPTLAGVVLGLLIPAESRHLPTDVLGDFQRRLNERVSNGVGVSADELAWADHALSETVSPLDRFEYGIHPWVAYAIMPLFALANSGVDVSGLEAKDFLSPVFLGTVVGLFVGKMLGISAFTAAAVKLKLSRLPSGASWGQVLGVGAVAGIGFTVALFIANLAFGGGHVLLDEARLGILVGSALSGTLGVLLLRLLPARPGAVG
ncbi:MAG: Na+/H+ antiporter NhaA [Myxococcaceae bacterium]